MSFTCMSSSEIAGEHEASPYKELDDFVLQLVQRDGIQGSKHAQTSRASSRQSPYRPARSELPPVSRYRHQALDVLRAGAAAGLRHREIPPVLKRGPLPQEQQHHVSGRDGTSHS